MSISNGLDRTGTAYVTLEKKIFGLSDSQCEYSHVLLIETGFPNRVDVHIWKYGYFYHAVRTKRDKALALVAKLELVEL
jgi:hypothetical protein